LPRKRPRIRADAQGVKAAQPASPLASATASTSRPRAPEHLRILSRPDWVEPVAMFLKEKAMAAGVCDDAGAQRLVIAMTEAITNAVVHGNYELSSALKEQQGAFREALEQRKADPTFASRVVDVRVDFQPDRCIWTVTDQGRGFDVEHALSRLDSDDPEVILASGRGISIMKAFVDEVWWDQNGRQVHLAIHMGSGPERRGAARHKYTRAVAIHRDAEPDHEAIARDLSVSGIAAVTSEPINLGEHVQVTLDLRLPSEKKISGMVVRCNHVAGDFHDVAVHFDQTIDLADHTD
jgi:anti-sigma regulatory factor (Ser/Thr protein kinase)